MIIIVAVVILIAGVVVGQLTALHPDEIRK